MRLDRYLIHHCTLERESKTKGISGEDIFTWVELPTLPCRFHSFDQSVASPSLGQVVEYDAKIILAPTTDILLTDRVKSVILENDVAIAGRWLIEEIVTKRLVRASESTTLMLRKPKEGDEL